MSCFKTDVRPATKIKWLNSSTVLRGCSQPLYLTFLGRYKFSPKFSLSSCLSPVSNLSSTSSTAFTYFYRRWVVFVILERVFLIAMYRRLSQTNLSKTCQHRPKAYMWRSVQKVSAPMAPTHINKVNLKSLKRSTTKILHNSPSNLHLTLWGNSDNACAWTSQNCDLIEECSRSPSSSVCQPRQGRIRSPDPEVQTRCRQLGCVLVAAPVLSDINLCRILPVLGPWNSGPVCSGGNQTAFISFHSTTGYTFKSGGRLFPEHQH